MNPLSRKAHFNGFFMRSLDLQHIGNRRFDPDRAVAERSSLVGLSSTISLSVSSRETWDANLLSLQQGFWYTVQMLLSGGELVARTSFFPSGRGLHYSSRVSPIRQPLSQRPLPAASFWLLRITDCQRFFFVQRFERGLMPAISFLALLISSEI